MPHYQHRIFRNSPGELPDSVLPLGRERILELLGGCGDFSVPCEVGKLLLGLGEVG